MEANWIDPGAYELAERFRDECLLADRTMLDDGAAVFTAENLDRLLARIDPPDHESKGSFVEKLIAQTSGQSDEVIRLAAELVCVQLLGEADTYGPAKTEHVTALLGAMREPVALTDRVLDGLDGGGVANYAAGKARRDVYLRLVARVARAVKNVELDERRRLLDEPFAFRDFIAPLRTSANGMGFYALLHLLFRTTFSTAVSAGHREALLGTFAPVLTSADDEDRRLLQLQELINVQAGWGINFYDWPMRAIWNGPDDERWTALSDWASRLYSHPTFAEQEYEYKQRVVVALSEVKDKLGDDGWVEALRGVVRMRDQNLVDWRQADRFLNWCEEDPSRAVSALRALGWPASDSDITGESSATLIERFLAAVPGALLGGPGGQLAVASLFLLAVDGVHTPPFRWTPYTQLRSILDLEAPPTSDPEDGRAEAVRVWEQWDEIVLELRLRMLGQGIELRDSLEAQGLAYWIATYDPPEDWDDAARTAFLRFQAADKGGAAPAEEDVSPGPGAQVALPEISAVMADELLLPLTWLRDTQALLSEKRQLILYGPPGTGKTWIARRLARHLTGGGDALKLVQFHASYTYEDFFQGYRPTTDDAGNLSYVLTDGPLRLLADRARRSPRRPHVLIIDEINRGNVAKVFGELYFLLEYRDEAIALQYSPQDSFSLPENLFVIGTMNTADRSIALVDSALRRRFHFQALMPTREPISDLLRTWLTRYGFDLEAAELLRELNARIADEEASIGPSYFMTDPPRSPELEHIWEHQLVPLLEEHFFERRHEIQSQYGLDALRTALAARAAADDASREATGGEHVPPDDHGVG